MDDGCETPGRRVFVTSSPVIPTFVGAASADSICQSFADAAQLGGTWLSWTSDLGTSPAARFNQSQVPYYLVDGTLVANDWGDLTDGFLTSPINVDENGTTIAIGEVWTGTNPAGASIPSEFCGSNWLSNNMADIAAVGRLDLTDSEWSDIFFQTCDRTDVHLYCFEQ